MQEQCNGDDLFNVFGSPVGATGATSGWSLNGIGVAPGSSGDSTIAGITGYGQTDSSGDSTGVSALGNTGVVDTTVAANGNTSGAPSDGSVTTNPSATSSTSAPLCPSGQSQVSNGKCDVPLAPYGQQFVTQAASNLSNSSICSVLLGGSGWAALGPGAVGVGSTLIKAGSAAPTSTTPLILPPRLSTLPTLAVGAGVQGISIKVGCAIVNGGL